MNNKTYIKHFKNITIPYEWPDYLQPKIANVLENVPALDIEYVMLNLNPAKQQTLRLALHIANKCLGYKYEQRFWCPHRDLNIQTIICDNNIHQPLSERISWIETVEEKNLPDAYLFDVMVNCILYGFPKAFIAQVKHFIPINGPKVFCEKCGIILPWSISYGVFWSLEENTYIVQNNNTAISIPQNTSMHCKYCIFILFSEFQIPIRWITYEQKKNLDELNMFFNQTKDDINDYIEIQKQNTNDNKPQ